MPIDTVHEDLQAILPQIKRCRDVGNGADAVKGEEDTYLPRLGGQNPDEYKAYLKRGFFLEAFPRTVQGLSGAVFRKPARIEHSPRQEVIDWLLDVDGQGQPLERFAQACLDENLAVSRFAIWLTMDDAPAPGNVPRLVLVPGEHIINWADDGRWVVIKETVMESDAADQYEKKAVDQWRLFFLDAMGFLVVQLWRRAEDVPGADPSVKFALFGSIQPGRLGKRIDFIPVWIVNGHTFGPAPRKPDLLGLADANLDHYRMITDYRHGLHWTALPTPWSAGFQTKEAVKIGSGTLLSATDPNAKFGMLEFTGQGLQPLQEAIREVVDYMAALGARLLEQPKRAAEAFETQLLRARAEQTTVQSMAWAVGQVLTKAVRRALWWGNRQDDTFTIRLNMDLVDASVDPQLLAWVSGELQAGHITYETYYSIIEGAELARPGVTAEAEQAQIGDIDDDTFDAAAG